MDEIELPGVNPISELAASACQIAETVEKVKDPASRRELRKLLKAVVKVCLPPEEEHIRVLRVLHFQDERRGVALESPDIPSNGDA